MANYAATYEPVRAPYRVNFHLTGCQDCSRFADCRVPDKGSGNCCTAWTPKPIRMTERDPLWEACCRKRQPSPREWEKSSAPALWRF